MRRFIDVVFVNPKGRYYVVLHQGEFWQLPKMSLTATSWEYRTPYEGSLNDIFVSKSQDIECPQLAQILSSHVLPEQLASISALQFLDWWQTNDYKITQQNPSTSSTPAKKRTSKKTKQTKIKAQTKQTSQKPNNNSSHKANDKANDKANQANSQTVAKAQTSSNKLTANTNDNDQAALFDDLLHQLNKEVARHNAS